MCDRFVSTINGWWLGVCLCVCVWGVGGGLRAIKSSGSFSRSKPRLISATSLVHSYAELQNVPWILDLGADELGA